MRKRETAMINHYDEDWEEFRESILPFDIDYSEPKGNLELDHYITEKEVKECNEESCELLTKILEEPQREFNYSNHNWVYERPMGEESKHYKDLDLKIGMTSYNVDFSGDKYLKLLELSNEFFDKVKLIISAK